MIKSEHLHCGAVGEKIAEKWLQKQGFHILERNWSTAQGELDLICNEQKTLVFVEVKTRRQGGMTLPGEAFTRKKQRRLVLAASEYISENQCWDMPCRFDFVGVVQDKNGDFQVEYERDVINFSFAVGSGNASWQPW